MKKIFFFLLTFLFLLFPSLIYAQQKTINRVNNFHSEITINQDTSISIKETIDYETNLNKHGIYRYIPYRYQKDGLSYTARIGRIKVTDDTQKNIPFEKSTDSKFITLKIGDPDITFTGEKTFVITYNIENALKRFDDYDELFWDIISFGDNSNNIPVLNTYAVINSSYSHILDINCFSGEYNKNDNQCQKSFDKNNAIFSYNNNISDNGETLSILVALDPNGSINFPTQTEKMIKAIKDNWFAFIAFLPLIIMFLLWNKKGRDEIFTSPNIYAMQDDAPKTKKPFFHQFRNPFHYEPITKLTPGQAGGLIDERIDNQDIISEIIDLARQKYLKLEEIKKKNIFGSKDYQFTKLKASDNKLPEHQKYLLDSIFSSKDKVKTSDLKGSFYTKMDQTRKLLQKSLEQQKLFFKDPAKARVGAFGLIFGLGFFIIPFSVMLASEYFSPISLVVAIISLIISCFFAYNMPAKTAIGTNYYLQTKGLKESINSGKWREEIHEKNLFIEEILPFAISLGVVKKLAKDMDKLDIKPPDYLASGVDSLNTFSTANFIDSFTRTAQSNLSYNPSSSSYSSGSGFSGGGSSGGGGGGGSVGSW